MLFHPAAIAIAAISCVVLVGLLVAYWMFRRNLRADLHLWVQMFWTTASISGYFLTVAIKRPDVSGDHALLDVLRAWNRATSFLVLALITSAALTRIARILDARRRGRVTR
jgi:hypothetical protein